MFSVHIQMCSTSWWPYSKLHEHAWRVALDQLFETRWTSIRDATQYTSERFTPEVYRAHISGKPTMSGARAALSYFGLPATDARTEEYARRKQRVMDELLVVLQPDPDPRSLKVVVLEREHEGPHHRHEPEQPDEQDARADHGPGRRSLPAPSPRPPWTRIAVRRGRPRQDGGGPPASGGDRTPLAADHRAHEPASADVTAWLPVFNAAAGSARPSSTDCTI